MVVSEQSYGSGGFALSYARDKGGFRVYFSFVLGIALLGAGVMRESEMALTLGILFLIVVYYFYPLIETDKVRIGAGEHGIFIEGFGVIPWRSVDNIELTTYAVRTIEVSELKIKLSHDFSNSRLVDRRALPWYRLLMKLPWKMNQDKCICINLEPFPGRPKDILAALHRTQRCFSSRS